MTASLSVSIMSLHDSTKPFFNKQVPAQPSQQLLALKTYEGHGDFLLFLLLFQADSPKWVDGREGSP